MKSYPTVHLNDSTMREGMQIESVQISVADKIRLLDKLSETGIEQLEVGSFVSPRYTPQMEHIDEVVAGFTPNGAVRYTGVVLNEKGKERRAKWMPPLSEAPMPVSLMTHLCDTFVRRNTNRSRQAEVDAWPAIVAAARQAGAREAGIMVGAAFGSNFEGAFSLEDRMAVFRQEHALWDQAGIPVTWLGVADPMSWCLPTWVAEQLRAALAEWPDITNFYLHLHDGRGMALPSIYAALDTLDDRHTLYLDVTAGGVGGCPYCGNGRATGMAPTEDVVHLLETMGIPTGVSLTKLIEAVHLLEELIGRPAMGHVSKAGPRPGPDELYDPNLPLIETHEDALFFIRGDDSIVSDLRPWREPIPAPAPRT
jgi:hydroxymethylglutaryl-CoA lyase